MISNSMDLKSEGALLNLYNKWCSQYRIDSTKEFEKRFDMFKDNAFNIALMNQSFPSCQFHLSFSCNHKKLFDLSGDEEMTLTPTTRDLETDEAVWDLYYRWCHYHKILRTREEMQKRFKNFEISARYFVEMNKKDRSSHFSLPDWCDKIELRNSSGVEEMTVTPTAEDLESDEDLHDLYDRWCLHHKISRRPMERELAFSNFKKIATHAFEMSQKDPTVQFCLSIGCDETDYPLRDVTLVPTERDLKSGNALLGLYSRYCRAYRLCRTRKEVQLRFRNFMESVNHVFKMNKVNLSQQFFLSKWCDSKDMLDRAAVPVSIIPTFRDLGSDDAVSALYDRWCHRYNIRRTPEDRQQRFNTFRKRALVVFQENNECPGSAAMLMGSDDELFTGIDGKVSIRPELWDLVSDEAMSDLYNRWCFYYNICTGFEKIKGFEIFKTNANHVFEMNELEPDPFCQFHLSSSCNEKDLFDLSGGEEMTLTPTEQDLVTDEAVWDLYLRWCLYHKIRRTRDEMQQRFKHFKISARYAVEMNKKGKKDPSSHFSLPDWCDKIELRNSARTDRKKILIPTEQDMESGDTVWQLYHRWCSHHKIRRTYQEMELAFVSFWKSAIQAFDMSKKDCTVLFCLSIWCDETDHPLEDVTLIPTERDLKSGNALMGLYRRYCRAYKIYRTPEEVQCRFYNFKKSVNSVFEMNKDPSLQFFLNDWSDEKDMHVRAAVPVSIIPTFRDLVSNEAVWALYIRWCRQYKIHRTTKEMSQRFNIFKAHAQFVFAANNRHPGSVAMLRGSDGKLLCGLRR